MSRIASYDVRIKIPKIHLPLIRLPAPRSSRPSIESQRANIEGVPSLEVLRKALQLVIDERGGSIQDTYTDHEGHPHSALLAISTRDFPQGIGIEVKEDGSVVFLYDTKAANESVAQAICRDITQNYVLIALLRAQQRRGFEVRVEVDRLPEGAKHIRVTAFKEAENRLMVDEHGKVTADFYGYEGETCKAEEDKLLDALEELGLMVEVKERRDKTEAQRQEELQELEEQLPPESSEKCLGMKGVNL